MVSSSITFSIVTAVLNNVEAIASCLNSVAYQRHFLEHIIVDGASVDGTVAFVRRKCAINKRIFLVSEPDHGIYDAMNKGIARASGDVVGLLNADDFYPDPRVLSRVAAAFTDPRVQACYGDLLYVHPTQTTRPVRRWRAGGFRPEQFLNGWMPPHPTFFVRREIYEKFGRFDLALGSAADYELMLRFLYRYRIRTVYIPRTLVHMRAGGVSNGSLKNRILANRMDRKAWRVNGFKPRPWTLWAKPLRKICQYRLLPKSNPPHPA